MKNFDLMQQYSEQFDDMCSRNVLKELSNEYMDK